MQFQNRDTFFLCLLLSLFSAACTAQPVILPTATPAPASPIAPTATITVTTIPTSIATETALLPISPVAAAYLEEALNIMQSNSLHRDTIDWETLRTSTFEMAKHAQTPADTYGAIRFALLQLGDHHSFFQTPEEATQWERLTASDSPAPRSKLLLGKLGFVAMGGFLSGIPEEQSKYASSMQQLIRNVDAQSPCGWIVDLRENTGGNMWPMLVGIGPILGAGKAGSFVGPDGDEVDWSYRDGQAFAGDEVFATVNGPAYQLKAASPPVAVLTGIYTASAGEAMVVSFRGRPNTRSFGRSTTGVSTANESFLMNDGAWIVLTVAVFADRTGQTYGDRIYPDELVEDVRSFTIILKEAIPQPAIDWLMSQPVCMARQ